MKIKQMYKHIFQLILISVLILPGAVVNAQGQDGGALDNNDPLLYDAQIYASNNNVSTEEALRRFKLQDSAGKLNAELSMNESGTFAGLWIEHKPEFKIVVQFTRDGEETIKPYLKRFTELADIIEVRTANVSLADLQRDQSNASYSVHALNIRAESQINVYNNSIELYVAEDDRSLFDDALQRREIQLPDTVKVITVEALAEEFQDASSSPAAQEAPGFGVFAGIIGILAVWLGLKK